MMTAQSAETDSDDLQALFDSIVSASVPQAASITESVKVENTVSAQDESEASVFSQIGKMTRSLHDTLRELGYDKLVEQAMSEMPDTRDRLSYVATMTEKAAQRTLGAAEAAKPIQEKIQTGATELSELWKKVFDKELGVDKFKEVAEKTRNYLEEIPKHTHATNGYLLEIMMAQDFQDLTGQVIKKITQAAQNLEKQLLGLLVEHVPAEKKANINNSLMNGPVVNAAMAGEVLTDQGQVDDLLASLGF